MDQSDSRNDNTLQDLGFGPEEDEEISGIIYFLYLLVLHQLIFHFST